MNRHRVVAILGPTGSGKARLAQAAARATGTRLLSCDSMKVYRGLEVGTAKPTAAQREGVAWYGLDLVDPWERFDASQFKQLFEELLLDPRPLMMSGGTMLYLKAATEGLGEVPPRDAEVRARLTAEAEAEGNAVLHARLQRLDPERAAAIHENDTRRLVRALEVHELTGQPPSSFRGQFGPVRADIDRVVFVVDRERADVYARINARVERMIEAGWIEECRRLHADPRGLSREASQAIGYQELLAWIEGGEAEPLSEVVRRIQTTTRRFAKRQLTWLKHLEGTVHRLQVGAAEEPLIHLDDVLKTIS